MEQGGSVRIIGDLACPGLQLVTGDGPGKSVFITLGIWM